MRGKHSPEIRPASPAFVSGKTSIAGASVLESGMAPSLHSAHAPCVQFLLFFLQQQSSIPAKRQKTLAMGHVRGQDSGTQTMSFGNPNPVFQAPSTGSVATSPKSSAGAYSPPALQSSSASSCRGQKLAPPVAAFISQSVTNQVNFLIRNMAAAPASEVAHVMPRVDGNHSLLQSWPSRLRETLLSGRCHPSLSSAFANGNGADLGHLSNLPNITHLVVLGAHAIVSGERVYVANLLVPTCLALEQELFQNAMQRAAAIQEASAASFDQSVEMIIAWLDQDHLLPAEQKNLLEFLTEGSFACSLRSFSAAISNLGKFDATHHTTLKVRQSMFSVPALHYNYRQSACCVY